MNPGPCCVCGVSVSAVTACGVYRTFVCLPDAGDKPASKWLGQKTNRGTGALQPALIEELRVWKQPRTGAMLDEAGLRRGVELWNAHMRAIAYNGAHRTALAILNGSFNYHGIPAVPEFKGEWLTPLSDGPSWNARIWDIPGTGLAPKGKGGRVLAGYDVNGMFLSAAASDLGTGAPVRAKWPNYDVLKYPGWVRVSTLEDAPHNIGSRWEELMWVPTPIAAYLRDAGAQFLIPESLVWEQNRRWLDPHVNLMRSARTALIGLGDDLAAVAVLSKLKGIYSRMLGGLLVSEKHNHGPALNHHWGSQVPALGQARMFRGIDKTSIREPGSVTRAVGIYVDAVWFTMPTAYADPPGLIVSTQLGKFKRAGRVPWTPELATAHEAGNTETLRKALAL